MLSGLLQENDDQPSFWAAMMIGNIGPRARDAIPALRAALANSPCKRYAAVTLARAIVLALKKLREDTPEPKCRRNMFGYGTEGGEMVY
jgi:hypothetical protein